MLTLVQGQAHTKIDDTDASEWDEPVQLARAAALNKANQVPPPYENTTVKSSKSAPVTVPSVKQSESTQKLPPVSSNLASGEQPATAIIKRPWVRPTPPAGISTTTLSEELSKKAASLVPVAQKKAEIDGPLTAKEEFRNKMLERREKVEVDEDDDDDQEYTDDDYSPPNLGGR